MFFRLNPKQFKLNPTEQKLPLTQFAYLYTHIKQLHGVQNTSLLYQHINPNHHAHHVIDAQYLMSVISVQHRFDTTNKDACDFHYDEILLPHKMAISELYYGAKMPSIPTT